MNEIERTINVRSRQNAIKSEIRRINKGIKHYHYLAVQDPRIDKDLLDKLIGRYNAEIAQLKHLIELPEA